MKTKLETIHETRNSYVLAHLKKADNNRYNRDTTISTPLGSAEGAYDMLSNSYSFLPIVSTP